MQDGLDGKAGKVLSLFGLDPLAQQLRLHGGQGIHLGVQIKNQLGDLNFPLHRDQLIGFALPAVEGDLADLGGSKTGGGIAAQPAAGLGQLVHIVPDPLGDGLPLQLRKHRNDIHHGSTHGGGGIELLPDGDKIHIQLGQFVDHAGKIAEVAADSIQTVDHDGFELVIAHLFHHPLICRPMEIAAGEALILKNLTALRGFRAIEIADILPAQLHLIADGLTLAGESGFAGVNGDCPFISLHKCFPLFL